MRIKMMLKTLAVAMILTCLSAFPVSAAHEETVSFGDDAYQIVVPGFIEGRDVTIDGETVHAIVVEKPEKKSNGRYDFFEVVTTDPDVFMITSTISTMYDPIGDLMLDIEDGHVTFSPSFYEDFDEAAKEPLYFGFSLRDIDFNVIYDFPIWFVFEDGDASSGTPEVTPAPEPVQVKEVVAKAATPKVIVDGKQVAFYTYNIDGYNYFKLRDLAMAINGSDKQFEVSWDSENKTINLLTGEAYTSDGKELAPVSGPASVKGVTNQSKIYLDGEEIALEAYNINGNNYFKLKDLASVIDFELLWDGVNKQIIIDSASSYTEQ
ncbi:hypothetical protein LY28_01115 [Ruminiclostridium sufflavum DSM 19573]|uniref:Copper amine oxidase-like protein n=1 Tax=Ruminiclostridium sufflavum DSM 19573 TaxID=1121337 RepID=A0A318XP97_9FIRM|nr:hypothetical protein [Ruminiclostridium sufflavum]PYG88760.1 hypothetical protein LY28_01115 [Ruminiclostridium sufflavum DSM 19573]